MKKNIIGFALFTLLISSYFAYAQERKTAYNDTDYIKIIILDKGIKRVIHIPNNDSPDGSISVYSSKQLESKDGIIIKFKDPSHISMVEFETQYGVKLKKKLSTGYYIFQNISNNSDTEIVASIIKDESNVKTVKPNWKKRNKIR